LSHGWLHTLALTTQKGGPTDVHESSGASLAHAVGDSSTSISYFIPETTCFVPDVTRANEATLRRELDVLSKCRATATPAATTSGADTSEMLLWPPTSFAAGFKIAPLAQAKANANERQMKAEKDGMEFHNKLFTENFSVMMRRRRKPACGSF